MVHSNNTWGNIPPMPTKSRTQQTEKKSNKTKSKKQKIQQNAKHTSLNERTLQQF